MFQVSQLADCCRGPSSPRAPRLASSSAKTSLRRPRGLLQNQFMPMTKRDTENITLVTVRALRYNAAKLLHFYNAWPRSQVTDECEPCFAFCWIWEARRLFGAFIIPLLIMKMFLLKDTQLTSPKSKPKFPKSQIQTRRSILCSDSMTKYVLF